MRKIIKLNESDLVRIIKRVISEQTPMGPVRKEIKIQIPKEFKTQIGVNFKDEETPKSFLDTIKKSPVGMAGFHIESEGWKFPIYPVYAQLNDNFKISFEPLNKERGLYLLKWKKNI